MDKLCGWAAVNFEQMLHALGQPGCASMLPLQALPKPSRNRSLMGQHNMKGCEHDMSRVLLIIHPSVMRSELGR